MEVIGRNQAGLHALGVADAGQVRIPGLVGGQTLERAALLVPIEEVGRGHPFPVVTQLGNGLPHGHDAADLGKRQRVQYQRVDGDKTGGIDANS